MVGSRDERDVSVWELNEGGPRPPLRSEPAKPGSLCWESTFSKHRQRDRQTPALRAVSKPWSHRASHSLQLAWRAESQAQPGREVSRVLGVSGGVGRCASLVGMAGFPPSPPLGHRFGRREGPVVRKVMTFTERLAVGASGTVVGIRAAPRRGKGNGRPGGPSDRRRVGSEKGLSRHPPPQGALVLPPLAPRPPGLPTHQVGARDSETNGGHHGISPSLAVD